MCFHGGSDDSDSVAVDPIASRKAELRLAIKAAQFDLKESIRKSKRWAAEGKKDVAALNKHIAHLQRKLVK